MKKKHLKRESKHSSGRRNLIDVTCDLRNREREKEIA